ncbi:MAG: methionyl-tRNA formyltransferase [Phycisphaerae bacterium]
MRVVFCGSGGFGIPSLRAILEGGLKVPLVVSQPPRPAGRGGKLRPTDVARTATDMGLPVLEASNVNDPGVMERIAAQRPDVVFVVDFGQFVSRPLRELAPLGSFNLHASLLPALRGAAPINRAIMDGHDFTGVTTFKLVKEMDAGPIYLQHATGIQPQETADELEYRLAEMGAELVVSTLLMLREGSARPRMQEESRATHAPRLSKPDGVIDWSRPAVEVRNLIHGTWPWPGGQSVFCHCANGKQRPVVIARARLADDHAQPPGEPGTVGRDLSVATGEGRLEVLQLKPAGKRLMDWKDFVNGYRVEGGDRFAPAT